MKKLILITYDDKTADDGEAFDLYSYLVNELDNRKIHAHLRMPSICKESTDLLENIFTEFMEDGETDEYAAHEAVRKRLIKLLTRRRK